MFAVTRTAHGPCSCIQGVTATCHRQLQLYTLKATQIPLLFVRSKKLQMSNKKLGMAPFGGMTCDDTAETVSTCSCRSRLDSGEWLDPAVTDHEELWPKTDADESLYPKNDAEEVWPDTDDDILYPQKHYADAAPRECYESAILNTLAIAGKRKKRLSCHLERFSLRVYEPRKV